jgi:hypothetical protein
MIAANHFGEDVKTTARNDHVDNFIQFGNFLCYFKEFAPIDAYADHGHGLKAHAERIGDGYNLEITLFDEAVVAQSNHPWRDVQLFGDLSKGDSSILLQCIDDSEIDFIGLRNQITDFARHELILCFFSIKVKHLLPNQQRNVGSTDDYANLYEVGVVQLLIAHDTPSKNGRACRVLPTSAWISSTVLNAVHRSLSRMIPIEGILSLP